MPLPADADSDDGAEDDEDAAPTVLAMASETELLRDRDFADCDDEELAELPKIIDRMKVVAPVRPARWEPSRNGGRSIDLRRTLRAACRTGGDPVQWRHRRRGSTARQIVMLADVSGSMQAYSRIYLRVLQGAVLGARAHAYVFATQLHPVTRALGRGPAGGRHRQGADDVARRLRRYPDRGGRQELPGHRRPPGIGPRSGGGRRLGRLGARRSGPAGRADGRLSRLAHRVIWVNPRKAAPGFAPLTGGMAAALPHVDTFVSGHSARSVQELLDAIAAA